MTAPQETVRRAMPAIAFDVALALVLGALTAGTTIGATDGHSPPPAAFALIGVIAAFLAVRRWWPEVTLVGAMAALWVYLYLGLPEGPVFLLPAVAVFFYAFARPLKTTLIVVAALFAANTAFQSLGIHDGPDLWVNATITIMWLGIPTVGGLIVREARRARARAREAERERHRADERVAMAREIHDVVGHSLAVVSMNAGVALHVLEKRPDAAPAVIENLRAIRDTSKRALDDLRATLQPLRAGDQPELRPAFALGDVPTLVDDVRKGGLKVDCQTEGDPETVPPRIASTAYRVVQEALTNVIRHAEATKAVVVIDCGPETLTVDVTDDGRGGEVDPDRVGQGITGMMERVAAHGGVFRAGSAPGGGFAVHAELPYTRGGERA